MKLPLSHWFGAWCSLLLCPPASAGPAGVAPPPLAESGYLERKLDPTGAVAGTVSVYVEFYSHSGPGRARGTLVATEGGPGYPATESRDDYLALFKPLMTTHDVLIMDNRGTGKSGALDCHALQTGERWTERAVGECGDSLKDRASLYSTAYAADDLAAVLSSRHITKIDLYGDSYGTFFAQVFAIRHPRLLRSLILDGAYPLSGPDYAWYPSYAPAMRDKFNLACRRSPSCASLPGSSIDHIMPALELLRSRPFMATAHDVDGKERQFRADPSQLAIVMFGSAPKLITVREVDAAARAFSAGDQAPLLRLMAETASAVDSRDPTANTTQWSAGLAAAVMCQDAPQVFDMQSRPAERRRERDRALAYRRDSRPDTYAPFTIDEYRGMPLDYSFLDQCVDWPVPPPRHPAGWLGSLSHYPDVPALIISGDLDNITTPEDGAAVAAAFKHALLIHVANSFHVNALPRARSACAAEIAQHFIGTLRADDTSCLSRVPPVRLVARFVRQSSDLDPAAALPGNSAGREQLQSAAAAVLTAADVLARAREADAKSLGVGLRGGTFRQASVPDGIRVTLDGVRWTDDLSVNGTVEYRPGQVGIVHATLQLNTSSGSRGRLTARWVDGSADPESDVRIDGVMDGVAITARLPAP